MKILVTGDREWSDRETMLGYLSGIRDKITCLVHGDCRGADKMADRIVRSWGVKSISYPAEWDLYGKAAGVMRNSQMLQENLDIELVLAFHTNIEKSRGTKDMIEKARKRSIPVVLVTGLEIVEYNPVIKGFFRI